MENFDDKKKLVSVYNEAQLQIMRLNNIWVKCHNHRQKGDLVNYKWELDGAWIELSTDAKQTNPDFYFPAIEKINLSISKTKNPDILYHLLQKKEMLLKQLQEDAGKGGKRMKEGGSWY